MPVCRICNIDKDNHRKLSKHIRDHHAEYRVRDYYDKFIKCNGDGYCSECASPTKFVNLSDGYRSSCGNVCAGIAKRRALKLDDEKYNNFCKKVAQNQLSIWKIRAITGEKSAMLNKLHSNNREFAAKLSTEERIARFGYMNKLSPTDKAFVYGKILATKTIRGIITDNRLLPAFIQYKKAAHNISRHTYKQYMAEINPNNYIRGTGRYHLGHIYSIFDGFVNNVPLNVISSKHNLQIIPATENLQKSRNSWMTLEELYGLQG
jgi:hypothetical protein